MIDTNYKAIDSIIYPPGNVLNTDINIKLSGNIVFETTSYKPLPSLVEAKWNDKESALDIKALIFINSSKPLSNLNVSQLFSISNFGNCKLQFFIYCPEEDLIELNKNETPNEYQAYTVEFSTNDTTSFPEGITLQDIQVVQTFLWNIDPGTSRGTETSVQTTD